MNPATGIADVNTQVAAWYDAHARELPWRRPGTDAWGVLVSEVMLQQTPVARVVPAYLAWLDRWPRPVDLAAASAGDAVRAWGRLGYPRRALRLHAAAVICANHHNGQVPGDLDTLLTLPGVGDYTAAAVAAFAFGQRVAVLDTNVRRVRARVFDGVSHPANPVATRSEREAATVTLPGDPAAAAHVSVAWMELGALVCQSRTPACERCPVRDACTWHAAGHPDTSHPRRQPAPYLGTDRHCRGALLAVLREAENAASAADLASAWPQREQRERCLASLVTDGLVEPLPAEQYRLPATRPVGPPTRRAASPVLRTSESR